MNTPPDSRERGKRRRSSGGVSPLANKAARISAGILGGIVGNLPGAVIGERLANSFLPTRQDSGFMPARVTKRRRTTVRRGKSKKAYKKTKRTIKKTRKRSRKRSSKSLVKTVNRIINHDISCATYKHNSAVALIAPPNRRSYRQKDIQDRQLNFGGADDILYIASVLFNGLLPNLSGASGTNSPLFSNLQALKLHVVHHSVRWCIRNADAIEGEITHYEFFPLVNTNTSGGVDMNPVEQWAKVVARVNTQYKATDDAGTPVEYKTTDGTKFEFIQNLGCVPGDYSNQLKKVYRVKARTYKLVPGQCKVVGWTNKFNNREYDYSKESVQENGDVLKAIKGRSSHHVWMHKNEVILTTANGSYQTPKPSTVKDDFEGQIATKNIQLSRPQSGIAHGIYGMGVMVVEYEQICRIRAPDAATDSLSKEGVVYVEGLAAPIASTTSATSTAYAVPATVNWVPAAGIDQPMSGVERQSQING